MKTFMIFFIFISVDCRAETLYFLREEKLRDFDQVSVGVPNKSGDPFAASIDSEKLTKLQEDKLKAYLRAVVLKKVKQPDQM